MPKKANIPPGGYQNTPDAQAWLAAIVESSSDAIIGTTLDGIITNWNAAAARLYGYRAADIIGQSLLVLVPPDKVAQYNDILARVRRGEPVQHYDTVRVARDGRRLDVSVTLSPIYNQQGDMIGISSTAHDISERKLAEERLKESEARFRQLAENIPVAFCLLRPDLREAYYVSPAFEAVWGLTCEQFYEDPTIVRDYVHPDDRERNNRYRDAYILSGNYHTEYRIIRPDGELRWVESQAFPIRNDQDEIYRLAGFWEDITERRLADERLTESEARFRQLAENIRAVFWLLTPDLQHAFYISPAYETIWGRSCQSYYDNPKSLLETIHPDDRERVRLEREQYIALGKYHTEYRIIRPDGEMRWVESQAFPIRDEHGSIHLIAGLAEDITERKLADERLQESEARFRQLAENIRVVFWLMSPDLREVHYISPAFETMWGLSREQFYENPLILGQYIHPDDRERAIRYRETHLLSGNYRSEYRLIRPDGELRWIESRAFPIRDDQGNIYRVAGFWEDITEHKRLEERAFQAAFQQEQVRLVTEFIQNTSHEFRTPLAIMSTSLYLLRRIADTEKQAQKFDLIEEQIGRLTSMIEALHQMIRLDTDVSFQTQPTSLNYLIEDIIKANLKPRAAEKGLAVSLDLHRDLPVIRANAGLLRQALLHLIDNALLYTDQGAITLRTAEEAQGIVIEVSDTGIGIAEEHLAHIFERFYKVDPARTAGRSGVGLGLAMVKKIVESHKGTVTVDSIPGQGSTFRLHLPLSQ